MLRIEKFVLPSPDQWGIIIDGMRNPMDSWDKSDSGWHTGDDGIPYHIIGTADRTLMTRLVRAGSDHAKFRRMIPVFFTIVAPLYWWKEFDTYKIGTTTNSCSTMHRIHASRFTRDDFSHQKLKPGAIQTLDNTIDALNYWRSKYLETHDKSDWEQLIELLPSSYNQRRTVALNYEVLSRIYHARQNHKLTEWHTFCDAIETLPLSELITGEVSDPLCTT